MGLPAAPFKRIAAVAASILALAACRAHAAGSGANAGPTGHERLRAVVLQLEPNARIYARHDAFDGMPAMTMEFAVEGAPALAPGDTITAAVDATRDPLRLSDVSVTAAPRAPVVHAPRTIAIGDPFPRFAAIDQTGRRTTVGGGRPESYAVTFVYTRCRDPRMCPAISAKIAQVQARLQTAQPRLFEITLDPRYDSPRILAAYARQFGLNADTTRLLRGDPAATAALMSRVGILSRPVPEGIIHTDRVVIVRPDGRVASFLDDARWKADALTAALRDAR